MLQSDDGMSGTSPHLTRMRKPKKVNVYISDNERELLLSLVEKDRLPMPGKLALYDHYISYPYIH